MTRETIRHGAIRTPTVDLIQLLVNFMVAGEFCWKTKAHNNIDMSGKEPNDKEFLTTRWSEVEQAGNAQNTAGFQARDNVVKRYYPALVAHLVSVKRIPVQRAEDYLQSFGDSKNKKLGYVTDVLKFPEAKNWNESMFSKYNNIVETFDEKSSLNID